MKIISERNRLIKSRNLLLFFLISGEVNTLDEGESINNEITRLNKSINSINNMTVEESERDFKLVDIQIQSSLNN